MNFLGHGRYPKFFWIRIIHELGVLCDGLFGHGVDNIIAHIFNIDDVMKAIGRLVECLGDGICRGCGECKIDDMVEGLPCNIGGSPWGKESDGWQGRP
jgi:hypothetical protein